MEKEAKQNKHVKAEAKQKEKKKRKRVFGQRLAHARTSLRAWARLCVCKFLPREP